MELTDGLLKSIASNSFTKFASTVILVVIPIMVAGIVASLMQTGFFINWRTIKTFFKKA